MSTTANANNPPDHLRLDKWLWAARFYKTRALAVSAIKGGKILVNDHKPKPARLLAPGDEVCIKKPPYEYVVRVNLLSAQRRSAQQAAALYTETAASIAARTALQETLKLANLGAPVAHGRPEKRQRRKLAAFIREMMRQ